MRDDLWGKPASNSQQLTGQVERLSERTLGIVGFGNIGKLVAKKTRGIFARSVAADPFVKPEVVAQHGVELLSLEDLLRQSDYVTLHVLLTSETRHLINAERLALMKRCSPRQHLSGTNRRREGADRGAGSRNSWAEPAWTSSRKSQSAPDHPLAQRDDVIVTPHLAVYSRTAMENWRIQPVQDAARILQGYYPRGLVNRQLKASLGLKEE